MKLKLSSKRITLSFIPISLVGALLIFSLTFPNFIKWPWGWEAYFIIAIWVVSSIFFYVLTIQSHYYVLTDKQVEFHKFKKTAIYNFKEIVYIDQEYTEKHKTIRFVTNLGDVRYLIFDKDGLIYKKMLEKCKNLTTIEDVYRRFPQIKGLK